MSSSPGESRARFSLAIFMSSLSAPSASLNVSFGGFCGVEGFECAEGLSAFVGQRRHSSGAESIRSLRGVDATLLSGCPQVPLVAGETLAGEASAGKAALFAAAFSSAAACSARRASSSAAACFTRALACSCSRSRRCLRALFCSGSSGGWRTGGAEATAASAPCVSCSSIEYVALTSPCASLDTHALTDRMHPWGAASEQPVQ